MNNPMSTQSKPITLWLIDLPIMIITEELWEIMEQDQKDPQGSPVQLLHGLGQLSVAQERRQELEQRSQQLKYQGYNGKFNGR